MNWTPDKIKHYKVGYIPTTISVFVALISFLITFSIYKSKIYLPLLLIPLLIAVLLIIIAALKELLWDKLLKQGTPEWDDFKATLYGIKDGLLLNNSKF